MSEAPILEELRPRAFAVAYRMLGSVSEAEDIVQEALLRLHHTLQQGERIESPRAYLSTVVTRLCIDHLRSARVRRESYVGEWLPEPLVDDETAIRWIRRRWPTRFRSRSSFCSRACPPRSARCSCYGTCSTMAMTRSPRSSGRARTTPASWPRGRAGVWRNAGLASSPPGSSATSLRAASSRPPKREISGAGDAARP